MHTHTHTRRRTVVSVTVSLSKNLASFFWKPSSFTHFTQPWAVLLKSPKFGVACGHPTTVFVLDKIVFRNALTVGPT